MANLWIIGNPDDIRFPASKIAKSLGIDYKIDEEVEKDKEND